MTAKYMAQYLYDANYRNPFWTWDGFILFSSLYNI